MTEAHLAAALQGLGVGTLIGWQVRYLGPGWFVYPAVFVAFAALLGGYALDVQREWNGENDD